MTDLDDRRRSLAWEHGVVTLERLGGMLGPSLFLLPNGRQIAPLQVAPWFAEPGGDALPGVLRRLRGEWPCVPFGSDADRRPSGGWPGSTAAQTMDPFPHGYGSNHDWAWQDASGDRLRLAIDYPAGHPISRLERSVSPDPSAPAIDLELVIVARADCTIPVGLHPVFRLPSTPGEARIEIEGATGAATYPGNLDASSIFAEDAIVSPWTAVRLRSGATIDPSSVPFAEPTEDLLQIVGCSGKAHLTNLVERYRATLTWDAVQLPSLLLWFSNRGRTGAPWLGRHLALGVEPVCSAFDLGPQISAAPNPISARGVRTAVPLCAGERFVTRYRIAVSELAN